MILNFYEMIRIQATYSRQSSCQLIAENTTKIILFSCLIKEFLAALLRGQSASVASFLWSPELALGSIPFDSGLICMLFIMAHNLHILLFWC
jgi:hypothetical protein